jgi:TRAP-type C4-dicarboxylate transport system permease small subunit
MKSLEQVIAAVEKLFEAVTAFLMLLIMMVVVIDVCLRYFFNSPLTWAYDLIGLYLMAGVFFLSVSSTYAMHKHIGLDILVQKFPETGRRLAEIVTSLLAIPLFALIAKVGAERAWSNWANGDAMAGLIAWPTWIAAALVPLGIGLLVLRLVFRLIGQIASLATGKSVVALVPLVGHGTE